MTQSSFWNFDALFTPQDHPARELQDTFYLDGISAKKIATLNKLEKFLNLTKRIGDIFGILMKQEKWY